MLNWESKQKKKIRSNDINMSIGKPKLDLVRVLERDNIQNKRKQLIIERIADYFKNDERHQYSELRNPPYSKRTK